MNRVVITGMGVVSPVGNNIDEFFKNVKEGNHGFKKISSFDTTDYKVKVAGEIPDFNPEDYGIDKREARRMDRYCQFAVAASDMAIKDSEINFSDYDEYRVGCIIGAGIGGFATMEAEHTKLMEKGPGRVSPVMIPMVISNMASGTVCMRHKIKGASYSLVTACASSTNAIGEAMRAIRHGYMDVCVAGGAEAVITPLAVSGFSNMTALTVTEDVDRASIPFDKERSGFVMSEGAAVVVLESLESALKRGAKIYAEVAGYGFTSDAYHITSPDPEGEGAAKAMKMAVEDAGLTINDVDYINAHGTSTPLNDKYETIAIKKAFGERAYDVHVSSTKGVTGHLLGAAGAIEAIVCAMSLKEGVIPPTANYKEEDPECDLNVVPNSMIKMDIKTAVSNSLGFGGHNGSLLFKKYE